MEFQISPTILIIFILPFLIELLDLIYQLLFFTILFWNFLLLSNINFQNWFFKLTAVQKMEKSIFLLFVAHIIHWRWFEEVIIVCLVQKYAHNLIDDNFAY
jgi:hypothetical protein